MTHKTFPESLDERLESIELVVASIAHQGEKADLRALRVQVLGVVGLLKRDPGIEAAADDLYEAATALVLDGPVGSQPLARKLRLLKDARLRFRERLLGGVERVETNEDLRSKASSARYEVRASFGGVSM
jgi:hypothetical protein